MEPVSMENKENRRKSSILKPQKTRKPFGDVDLGNEDSGDATNMNKTDRRVSFASNNYVKPFAADPEKNTIWDTTYEEAIQSSGSLQSRDMVSELNTTLSIKMCSEYKDDSVCDEIEFTAPVNGQCADSEDVKDSKPMEMDVSDMDLTEIIETVNDTVVTDVEMEFATILTETVKINNMMELTEVEMEFTTPVNIIFPSENKNDLNHLGTALDLTHDDTVKPSDFSKVINGDLVPSFSNLPRMPLRGINSTSFVQSLTKEEVADISLLCDTSVALISDGSLSNDNIKINNPVDDENETVDASRVFDNMEMVDMQKVYQLEAESLCLEKSIEEATSKICKRLEETNLFYLKQLEAYSKAKHIMDEFFSTREKQEHLKATKDKILKLYEGNEDYWSIKSLDGNIFEFSTLYGTIEVSVQLNDEDGYVLDIELRDRINRGK